MPYSTTDIYYLTTRIKTKKEEMQRCAVYLTDRAQTDPEELQRRCIVYAQIVSELTGLEKLLREATAPAEHSQVGAAQQLEAAQQLLRAGVDLRSGAAPGAGATVSETASRESSFQAPLSLVVVGGGVKFEEASECKANGELRQLPKLIPHRGGHDAVPGGGQAKLEPACCGDREQPELAFPGKAGGDGVGIWAELYHSPGAGLMPGTRLPPAASLVGVLTAAEANRRLLADAGSSLARARAMDLAGDEISIDLILEMIYSPDATYEAASSKRPVHLKAEPPTRLFTEKKSGSSRFGTYICTSQKH